MSFRKFTIIRGALALVSTAIEEAAIWAVWRFLLPDLGVQLSVTTLIILMAIWLAFSIGLFLFTTFFLRKQSPEGPPSCLGSPWMPSASAGCKASGPLMPNGMVRIKGELWSAESINGNIGAGEEIRVVGQDRMKLKVTRLDGGN